MQTVCGIDLAATLSSGCLTLLAPRWANIIIIKKHHMNGINNSRKGFTLVEIMIVVVIIGLLAAMAIPAFQKVRASSQDKAVLNNLRQLGSAADQYFLENGVSQVASTSLVGTGATQYIKSVQTVAGETYPTNLDQGAAVTASNVAGARTITYNN